MAKTLFQAAWSTGAATTGSATRYLFPCSQMGITPTESIVQIIFRSAGTLSNLYVIIVTNTTAGLCVIRTRKNAANGGQSISPSVLTGAFEDTTGKDSVAEGDLMDIQFDSVNDPIGSLRITVVSQLFDATTNTVTKQVAHPATMTAASTTFFILTNGADTGPTTTEANAKVRHRKGGIYRNLAVNVSAARATTSTVKSRMNGADGGLSVSLTGGVTGRFEDTSGSDVVQVDDDFNYTIITGTGVDNLTIQSISTEFISTTNSGLCLVGLSLNLPYAPNTTNYAPIKGRLIGETTETDIQTSARARFACSELTALVTQNNISAVSTINLRVNAASSINLLLSIPADTTGYFSDSIGNEILVPTDLINYRIVTGADIASDRMNLSYIAINTSLLGMKEFGGNFQIGTGRPIFGQ